MVEILGISTPAPTRRAPATAHRFRDDIQGLRAVAVLAVLGYHAGIPALSGGFVGVDVFLVISGYLITGLLLREIAATGRLSLAGFYARRARRLLPAAAVVLAAVALVSLIALPVTRWYAIAGDIAASALYIVNWHLAARTTDYLVVSRAYVARVSICCRTALLMAAHRLGASPERRPNIAAGSGRGAGSRPTGGTSGLRCAGAARRG